MVEIQYNVLFLWAFGVELDVENERKRVSRMWENVYFSIKKPKSFQSTLKGPGPWLQIAHFAHITLLYYVCNFCPQKLGPLGKILDLHLTHTQRSAHKKAFNEFLKNKEFCLQTDFRNVYKWSIQWIFKK